MAETRSIATRSTALQDGIEGGGFGTMSVSEMTGPQRAAVILLVLGEYLWQREVIPPSAQWGWALETCRKLGPVYSANPKLTADVTRKAKALRTSLSTLQTFLIPNKENSP